MKYIPNLILLILIFSLNSFAQTRSIEAESSVVTNHFVTVNGNRIPYSATAGTLPVWSDDDKAVATLFYTYYKRTDIKDGVKRPIFFSFNGGPGAASIWMHMGYTSPRTLNIDDEGFPVQPYGIKENPYSIIDVADIVYVNPVNVGLSRILDKDYDRSNFFGVNSDIKYLSQWVEDFINKYDRWLSPKYLIGESYGTTRCSGMALELQSRWHTTYLNGVILVSPTGLGIKRDGPVDSALRLPYFTATAWYHNKLDDELQSRELLDLLSEVENFTINELLPAISLGNSISDNKKNEIAKKAGRYSGLTDRD
ncbi:MAG: S10 family serine carboxypeptidase-like protein, partial [Cytophagales bacterium]